jgi:hypothetical protein
VSEETYPLQGLIMELMAAEPFIPKYWRRGRDSHRHAFLLLPKIAETWEIASIYACHLPSRFTANYSLMHTSAVTKTGHL